MTAPTASLYDTVLYPTAPLPQTHPDRLATMATWFGLSPADPRKCRYLEVGCGDASNLLPMAWDLSESTFVGIDLAEKPVQHAKQAIASLGVCNLQVEQANLMDLPLEGEPFDYIVAHGFYSWVPPEVQERLLVFCARRLSPHGVAYVSYNVLPGFYIRMMLRDMMRFHTDAISDPQQKIRQAIALVKFLADGQYKDDEFSALLHQELQRYLQKGESPVLLHDDLAELNEPLYFREFARRAMQQGLQYLAEANFFEMQTVLFPEATQKALHQLEQRGIVFKEQYLDFLKCRRFRQTLLCRREVALHRPHDGTPLKRLHLSTPAKQQPSIKASDPVWTFMTADKAQIATDHDLSKRALAELSAAWPASISYEELLRRVAGTSSVSQEDEAILLNVLLTAYSTGLLHANVHPCWAVADPGERPQTTEFIRWQIAQQQPILASIRHEAVEVADPIGRFLLSLLDGSRTRSDLVREIGAFMQAKGMLDNPNAPEVVERLTSELDDNLRSMAQMALLQRSA